MRFIRDIYAEKKKARKPVISLELFPPRTEEGDKALLEKHIPALMLTRPNFCSVTYGAGGSTRDKTSRVLKAVAEKVPERFKFCKLAYGSPSKLKFGNKSFGLARVFSRRSSWSVTFLLGDPAFPVELCSQS